MQTRFYQTIIKNKQVEHKINCLPDSSESKPPLIPLKLESPWMAAILWLDSLADTNQASPKHVGLF